MIASVRGKLTEKFGSSLVVETGDGVGYEIFVSADDFAKFDLQTEVKFYTYHAVRENSEELFGFSSLLAKRLFELLISVQGVGPKAALAILSLDSPDNVRNIIANGDAKLVSRAAGVGAKTAERVVLDLREKVGQPTRVYDLNRKDAAPTTDDEALDALMALGFTLADGLKMLENVASELPVEKRVSLALKAK